MFTPRSRTGSPALLSRRVPTTFRGRGRREVFSCAIAMPARRKHVLANAINRRFIAEPQGSSEPFFSTTWECGKTHAVRQAEA